MPPGKSGNASHSHLCPYSIIPTDHTTGFDCLAARGSLRLSLVELGKLRWTGKVCLCINMISWKLHHKLQANMSPLRVELHPGDYITISASRFPFANIVQSKSASEDWVNSISRTLSWNSRAKQKSFDEKPKQ